jgi:hypothetical protein
MDLTIDNKIETKNKVDVVIRSNKIEKIKNIFK